MGQQLAWVRSKGRTNESYQVLKSNPAIRYGIYQQRNRKGEILIEGFFKNNQKDSIWTLYDQRGRVTEVHRFREGSKIGIWQQHIERGDVILRYDYDHEVALSPMIEVKATYPPKAKKRAIEGVVKVHVTMRANCQIAGIQLIRKLGYGCDERAIRCVRRLANLTKRYNPVPVNPQKALSILHFVWRINLATYGNKYLFSLI
ncbi:MAG: hypothetical protein HKN87_06155 [Saprospiraceae bacterium]|nr:hypothetical protein [Saprospiraceae bacterium]